MITEQNHSSFVLFHFDAYFFTKKKQFLFSVELFLYSVASE